MTEPLFPILGAAIPRMIGRKKLLGRVWSDLTRATASNLSIVGPRFTGKTVLLKALAGLAETAEDSPYSLVGYWHLGHVCPPSDAEFIAELCQQISEVMAKKGSGFADYRQYLEGKTYSKLKEITDLLDSEDVRLLMIWDGFDKPLSQGRLSGHLWDQMRDIFYGKAHKIVTATRAPLDQLIRREDAITSPFWNIFDQPPTPLEPFDADDQMLACEQAGLQLSTGAKTELTNWTAGHPLLLLSLLNRLRAGGTARTIDNEAVIDAAKLTIDGARGWLDALWDDCHTGAKDLFRLLSERGELPVSQVARDEAECLVARGLAIRAGNRLKPACRMVQTHVRDILPDAGTLRRLFGTWESYRNQIRNILQFRLGQIPIVNNRLRRLVERSIEDIPDFADDCLNSLTNIEEIALDVIWENEFGAHKRLPTDLVAYWTVAPRAEDSLVSRLMDTDNWRVPSDRLDQVRLLQLLTGSKSGFDARAKKVSKSTYVLINAIHSFRNRSEHADGQSLHLGVAVAAIVTCVELLDCLARELK
jgi:hypothetical protein